MKRSLRPQRRGNIVVLSALLMILMMAMAAFAVDVGYIAERPVHIHDLQATVLDLLGIDHLRLTYRFQSRDYRLTDIAGEAVREALL